LIPDNVRLWLIHLYPNAWRERYEAEFDMLLEQSLHSPMDIVDVFLGALDAHLQLLSGENINWRIMNMLNKIRTTILIVFAAYIGFIVAGFSLVGLADDSPMIPLMKTDLPLALAWRSIQVAAGIALLSVVIGGLPLVLTIIRRAMTTDRHIAGLLLVPVISFLVLVIYVGFVFLVGTGRIQIAGVLRVVEPGNFPDGNRLMLAGVMLVFILGAVASTLAVWKAVTRTDVDRETFHMAGHMRIVSIYNFAYVPAVITTISMLVMLVGTLSWGWLAFSALPQVFIGNYGLWQTSTRAWYFGIITLMILCVLAGFFGLVRSRSARKAN